MSKRFFRDLWSGYIALLLFFLLMWLWASWWMGDTMRIAYERSYVAPDAMLMHWLWQKPLGWLWILGRILLTTYHWPIIGGLLVAILLTAGSWLFGYCLRLPISWRWLQFLPAGAWLMWTAHVGLNLFYMREPGRILAIPFMWVVIFAIIALFIAIYKARHRSYVVLDAPAKKLSRRSLLIGDLLEILVIAACFALPMEYLTTRHPYMRPLTCMQVQLLNNDYEGMSRTAHKYAKLSYHQMAGYYTIALARTGHLADQLFDIRLEYDTIRAYDYGDLPVQCLHYHQIDCNYHAGLIRAARHRATEELTLDGPSLYILKMLARISLVEGDWELTRKYLHIIGKAPFEGAFVRKYKPMIGRPDLVQADPEFAAILRVLPPYHTFEQFYLRPSFVGFYAQLKTFRNEEQLTWAAMACLYSKRMPEFLQLCRRVVGSMPPRSIAEALLLQSYKDPSILQAFPQLEMLQSRFDLFVQDAQPYMQDREAGAAALFDKYHGYYPYYYFFGNLRSSRKDEPQEEGTGHRNAGIN